MPRRKNSLAVIFTSIWTVMSASDRTNSFFQYLSWSQVIFMVTSNKFIFVMVPVEQMIKFYITKSVHTTNRNCMKSVSVKKIKCQTPVSTSLICGSYFPQLIYLFIYFFSLSKILHSYNYSTKNSGQLNISALTLLSVPQTKLANVFFS